MQNTPRTDRARSAALGMALASVVLALPGPAHAFTIALQPSSATAAPQSLIDVEIAILGLGDGAPPSLRAFDIDVSFAPALFRLDAVSFGSDLGASGQVLEDWNDLGGSVDVAATSLLSSAALQANQPGNFVLATLRFTTLQVGSGDFAFVQLV